MSYEVRTHVSCLMSQVSQPIQSSDDGSSQKIHVHSELADLRVALVHDFLNQAGGAERVLDVLHKIWPTAPIYTLVHNPAAIPAARYAGAQIRPSFIQRLPGGISRYKWYLPLMPRAIESFDLSGFDLVISDASAFAKGVIVPAGTLHVCYLHTPTRYLWSDRDSYLATAPVPRWARPVLNGVLPRLQAWDLAAAKRPDAYVANSNEVAQRLQHYYHRSAEAVIFPPVDANQFVLQPQPSDYWFTVARLEPYKRLDLILDAFAELGWPLKVAGTGSRKAELERWARFPTIEFVGRVSDGELAKLYGQAQAVVFAANEDAGIVPLEAMAAGRPVLAYGAGGSLESIVPGVTGEFFSEQTVDSLVAALRAFRPDAYDPAAIRARALTFDETAFADKIQAAIIRIRAQKEHHGIR